VSALYSQDILRLATSIPYLGRLAGAQASVERRSPVCGSRITVDIVLGSDGTVAAIGLAPNACALGQAATALLGQSVLGKMPRELAEARDALTDWLALKRPDAGDWPGLAVFLPALAYTGRHAAIRLPFEAAAEAAASAQAEAASQ
jgi:NifU-like protein involved in Fe-S cluster formation